MDFKNYGIIYALIILVAGVFLFTRLYPQTKIGTVTNQLEPKVATEGAKGSSVLIVDFGFGGKTYSSITAPNAYLALVEAVKGENLEVETKQGEKGLEVVKVGEVETGSAGSWTYIVNGQKQDMSPDTKLLFSGDTIEWRFVKNQ